MQAAGVIEQEPREADAIFEAPAVLRIVWADPQHMAEHIAIWSLSHFGGRARTVLAKLRAANPEADRAELERLVIDRQARIAMTEGAFVGGPFILLMAVAFCAALLAQAQMVFELAAVAGHEPDDEMRAADLLVLLGAYPTTDEASAALASMTRDPAQRGKRLPRGTRWDTVKRMGYLLEVFGSGEERSRLRNALGWIGISALFLVGIVLPLVWVPYMAYSSRRYTILLGDKARAYYAADQSSHSGVAVRGGRVRIGGTVALTRTLLLVVLPIVAVVLALVFGISFGQGSWIGSGIVLIAASVLATVGWLGYRWFRLRRARARDDASG
jgi:hypothetical protein